MRTALIVVVMLAAASAVLWHLGKKPAKHRNLDDRKLQALLLTLLRQGHQGGILYLDWAGGSRFLQVQKYIGPGAAGLQMDFPKAPWSAAVYQQVYDRLHSLGSTPSREATGLTEGVTEFLTVDFGRDVNLATKAILALLTDVFRVDLASDVVGRLINVSIHSDPRTDSAATLNGK